MEERKCPCEAMVKAETDLKEHDDRLHKGDTALALIEQRLDNMEKHIEKIDKNVEQLMQKPAKRWDSFISNICNILVAAVMTLVLVKIGLM